MFLSLIRVARFWRVAVRPFQAPQRRRPRKKCVAVRNCDWRARLRKCWNAAWGLGACAPKRLWIWILIVSRSPRNASIQTTKWRAASKACRKALVARNRRRPRCRITYPAMKMHLAARRKVVRKKPPISRLGARRAIPPVISRLFGASALAYWWMVSGKPRPMRHRNIVNARPRNWRASQHWCAVRWALTSAGAIRWRS